MLYPTPSVEAAICGVDVLIITAAHLRVTDIHGIDVESGDVNVRCI